MEELLQRAIARRGALRRELEAIDALIAAYHRNSNQTPLEKPTNADLFSSLPKRSRGEQARAVHTQMDAAERIILNEGKPLSRGALVQKLEENGHALEGADKAKVLGTNLWRSERFWNIKGKGYWPRSATIPVLYDNLPRS